MMPAESVTTLACQRSRLGVQVCTGHADDAWHVQTSLLGASIFFINVYLYIYMFIHMFRRLAFPAPPNGMVRKGGGEPGTRGGCEGCSAPASTLTLTLKPYRTQSPGLKLVYCSIIWQTIAHTIVFCSLLWYARVCQNIRFRASCSCRRLLLLRSSQEIIWDTEA